MERRESGSDLLLIVWLFSTGLTWKWYLSHRRTANAQSLRCSLTQYKDIEEASDNEPLVWPYWVAAHARLKDLKAHGAKSSFSMRRLRFVWFFFFFFSECNYGSSGQSFGNTIRERVFQHADDGDKEGYRSFFQSGLRRYILQRFMITVLQTGERDSS